MKVTDAELTATSGQVEAPQVSFAQRRFVVAAFTAVELTILRLDSLPDALDVTVSARDASAIYGLDYAGLSAPGEGGGDTHDKAVRATGAARLRRAQSSLTLTFEARQRLRVVYAHINNASQYRGLVRFAVSLRATSRAGGVAVAAPVASARVAILECGRFPNGFRDAKGVELSPSSSHIAVAATGMSTAIATAIATTTTTTTGMARWRSSRSSTCALTFAPGRCSRSPRSSTRPPADCMSSRGCPSIITCARRSAGAGAARASLCPSR